MISDSGAGGPKTAQGKAVVRWNATRHGISSPKPVVPGLGKQEDRESHRNGIMENLSPVGHLEVTLAERVALLSWRLHRVTHYETQTIGISRAGRRGHSQKSNVPTLVSKESLRFHPEDIRFEAKHNRQTHNALKRFSSLKAGKTLKREDASSVVWSVLMAAQKAIEEKIDVERLDLPGVPNDAIIEELPAMKVADVRGCIESIAHAVSEDPEGLLESATETARWDAVRAKSKAERTEVEINVMRRERILPDDKTLEKISRYEAHLSRQLYQPCTSSRTYRSTGQPARVCRWRGWTCRDSQRAESPIAETTEQTLTYRRHLSTIRASTLIRKMALAVQNNRAENQINAAS